jgi:hypothetical protein
MHQSSTFLLYPSLLLALLIQTIAAIVLEPLPPIVSTKALHRRQADYSTLDLQSYETFLWGGMKFYYYFRSLQI